MLFSPLKLPKSPNYINIQPIGSLFLTWKFVLHIKPKLLIWFGSKFNTYKLTIFPNLSANFSYFLVNGETNNRQILSILEIDYLFSKIWFLFCFQIWKWKNAWNLFHINIKKEVWQTCFISISYESQYMSEISFAYWRIFNVHQIFLNGFWKKERL